VRVVEIGTYTTAPLCARQLAALGADVVKVEPPDGDVTRLWGADIGGNPGYYHQQNVGKRNVCIDLTVEGGAELVVALAAKADIAIENFRPGVANRLGIGYAALSKSNPRLVMLSISGFGQDGPESQRAAYAAVIQAESGLVARQAEMSNAPAADLAVSLSDTNAALHGLVAVLSALLMRERTGLGQHIDMAMLDATLVTDDGLNFALENSESTKILPSEVWDTAAGRILISGDFRHIWNLLRSVSGVEDPATPGLSVKEKSDVRHIRAREYFRSLPDRESVISALARMNLAWGDVRDSANIREQPTVLHRGAIVQIDDRAGGTRPVVQSPYRFSAAKSGVRKGAPWHGEHNAEVLRDWLQMDEGELARWQHVLVEPGKR
jgi:crotonobetainyl-CoA:carnitine CoA-transferase CaiB-like acyl-CoA transferase